MAPDSTAQLTPAEPTLRWLAKHYGVGGVFLTPELVGTKTRARLCAWPDGTHTIELQPGRDFLWRIMATLHECGHKVRDETMAADRDYQLAKYAIRLYHEYRDAGNPAIQGFQELYEEEERIVNTWAWGELMHHFGPRYGREDDYESRGFVFQHRDP